MLMERAKHATSLDTRGEFWKDRRSTSRTNEAAQVDRYSHHSIVTIDAMGTQKAIAKQIIEQNGDYALALKKKQGLLYEKVENLFATARQENFEHVPHQQIHVADS